MAEAVATLSCRVTTTAGEVDEVKWLMAALREFCRAHHEMGCQSCQPMLFALEAARGTAFYAGEPVVGGTMTQTHVSIPTTLGIRALLVPNAWVGDVVNLLAIDIEQGRLIRLDLYEDELAQLQAALADVIAHRGERGSS